jgi:DNA-binding GntR family transcriptional regulator
MSADPRTDPDGGEGRTLREQVYDRLVAMIVSGEVAPGAPLREMQMAEALGTSRLPVREALQQLETEGWLERRPRGSARVRVPQEADIDEIFDMRYLLEVEAVAIAVRRASLEDVERLRGIAAAGRAAADRGDHRQATEANGQFHRELAALARHTLLMSFVEILDRKVHWLFSYSKLERFAEHDSILDALEMRDVEAARKATREHIELTRALLKERWLGNQATAGSRSR